MIVVSQYSLDEVGAALLAALHGATDHHGKQVVIGTIEPDVIRRVALGALTALTNDVVWPSDKVIDKGPEETFRWLKTVYPRG